MTNPIEDCNTHWKKHQLSLLFSGSHPKIIDFFKQLEVVNIEEKVCKTRSSSVSLINTDFSLLLTFQHTQTNELYYIWENEYQTYEPYGFLFQERKVTFSYFFKKYFLTDFYVCSPEPFIIESEIHQFFSNINFKPFLQKQKQYIFEKNLSKERENIVGFTCEDIIFDEKEEMYYIVLSNGTKIPYKKETEHKTNKRASLGIFLDDGW